MDRCVDEPDLLKKCYVELPQKWGGCGTVQGLRPGQDTLFRIHGTLEPFSIGKSVSSGCIRMISVALQRFGTFLKVYRVAFGSWLGHRRKLEFPECDVCVQLKNQAATAKNLEERQR